MNIVILTGRLVKDIEVIVDQKDGEWSCTRFSLACPDGIDKDGNKLTQFVNCCAWNERADLLEKYVHKGDMVTVQGRITQNNYKDKEGIMRYATEVTVSNIELLPNSRKEEKEEPEEKPKTKKYHR